MSRVDWSRVVRTLVQVVAAGLIVVCTSVLGALHGAASLSSVDWSTTLDVAGVAGLTSVLTAFVAALMNVAPKEG